MLFRFRSSLTYVLWALIFVLAVVLTGNSAFMTASHAENNVSVSNDNTSHNDAPVDTKIDEPAEVLHQVWFIDHSVAGETNRMNFTLKNVAGETMKLWSKTTTGKWEVIATKKYASNVDEIQFWGVDVKAPEQAGPIIYQISTNDVSIVKFIVENHDMADEDEYIQHAYNTVSELCGNVYFTYGDADDMTERKVLGLATTGKNLVTLQKDMDKKELEWVARHECGHMLQHQAYDNDRENYSPDTQRSILWLNEELSPYYTENNQNDRGTGYSEKNADCIAYALTPEDDSDRRGYCAGQKGQAAYNIIHGNTANSIIIYEDFQGKLITAYTGFAIENPVCDENSVCTQKFENGVAKSVIQDGETILSFEPDEFDVDDNKVYIMPSLEDTMNNYFSATAKKPALSNPEENEKE